MHSLEMMDMADVFLNHRFTLMDTDYTEKQKQIPLSSPYK